MQSNKKDELPQAPLVDVAVTPNADAEAVRHRPPFPRRRLPCPRRTALRLQLASPRPDASSDAYGTPPPSHLQGSPLSGDWRMGGMTADELSAFMDTDAFYEVEVSVNSFKVLLSCSLLHAQRSREAWRGGALAPSAGAVPR
jgi:hypothetical protein